MKRLTLITKKGFIIAGLSTLCVLLAIAIFAKLGSGMEKSESESISQAANNSVIVGEIEKDKINKPSVTVKKVVPENKQATNTSKPNDIQLTEIPAKPLPPEKPDTAVDIDKPHDIPKDINLTNPNKKPTETVKTVDPVKPQEDEPLGGETNSKGETYVPGFGWVKNSGSNEKINSQSNGDWNKQVGNMN